MKLTKNQTTETTIADLYRALDRRQPITITYTKADGTETIRTIEPYDIRTTKAGDVIVRAMDRETGEARTFRIDRIRAYTLHRTTFLVARPTDATPAPTAPATVEQLIEREITRDEPAVRPAALAA